MFNKKYDYCSFIYNEFSKYLCPQRGTVAKIMRNMCSLFD